MEELSLVLPKPVACYQLDAAAALALPRLRVLSCYLKDNHPSGGNGGIYEVGNEDEAPNAAATPALCGSLAHLTSLTRLRLVGCLLLTSALPPTLVELELEGGSSAGMPQQLLASAAGLTRLKFGRGDRPASALPPSLAALELVYCTQAPGPVRGWAQLLGGAPAAHLRSLKMHLCREENEANPYEPNVLDPAALGRLAALTLLDLQFVDFTGSLAAGLAPLSRLEELHLTGVRLPHDNFKPGYVPNTEFFDLPHLPSLRVSGLPGA